MPAARIVEHNGGSALSQSDGPSARSPGQVQVGPVLAAGGVHADPVELGKVVVVAGHDRVRVDDAGLVRDDFQRRLAFAFR